ncbi:MAG: biopolymer transporter ExbD [Thermodesulfobacteriota bacterium]
MKIELHAQKKTRIEMIPLIDIVFLVLVSFIYAMLSMAVHRGVTVMLPASSTAKIDQKEMVSVTVRSDGVIFLDKEEVSRKDLVRVLSQKALHQEFAGVLLFADRNLPYQKLYHILDDIRTAGIQKISLQAEAAPNL